MRSLLIVFELFVLAGCAPPGYEYDAGSFTAHPIASPSGAWVNASPPPPAQPRYAGDALAWSGIPPLPPSASDNKTAISDSRCTVADAAGHMLTIYATGADCQRWIAEAQRLSKNGPTTVQVREQKIEVCTRRLAASSVQEYSGEFYELCAGGSYHPLN